MGALGTVFLVSLLAGSATGLGAVPILFTERVSHRVYDGALGLAAGIMVGASIFTLVMPGLEYGSLPEVATGLFAGGLFLLGANRLVPHVHEEIGVERVHGMTDEDAARADALRRAALVGSAITIHNVPEGLAIGIAFASGLENVGLAIAFAIAVQNVPDGFAMAVPAIQSGLSKTRTAFYTTLSGAVPEPIAAVVGFTLVLIIEELFPLAAGLAAGAMLAVVFREIVPSSHGHGYADLSTVTFVLGFAVMMVIDTTFTV